MRLIDEAALINEAETGNWDIDLKELKMILKYVPTIDAVEVVRCGECKCWHNDGIHITGECLHMMGANALRLDSDYCSYGHKKDVM